MRLPAILALAWAGKRKLSLSSSRFSITRVADFRSLDTTIEHALVKTLARGVHQLCGSTSYPADRNIRDARALKSYRFRTCCAPVSGEKALDQALHLRDPTHHDRRD